MNNIIIVAFNNVFVYAYLIIISQLFHRGHHHTHPGTPVLVSPHTTPLDPPPSYPGHAPSSATPTHEGARSTPEQSPVPNMPKTSSSSDVNLVSDRLVVGVVLLGVTYVCERSKCNCDLMTRHSHLWTLKIHAY